MSLGTVTRALFGQTRRALGTGETRDFEAEDRDAGMVRDGGFRTWDTIQRQSEGPWLLVVEHKSKRWLAARARLGMAA